MRWLCVLALLSSACIHDYYHCATDSDCDLGTAGRCESDHYCTELDVTCSTERRYTAHSEANSGLCWDGTVTPLNVCAAGQPPASSSDGCASSVCTALPACCTTGWSSACVLEAEQLCDVQCDTRIAITATTTNGTELFDLESADGGVSWAPHTVGLDTALAYLAPAPGDTLPRLAGFSGPTLVVDGNPIALSSGNMYDDLTSVDFDRDARDTVVLGVNGTCGGEPRALEVVKLATGELRDICTRASLLEAWGDDDHDAFPDGVASDDPKYYLLINTDSDADGVHEIDSIAEGFKEVGTNQSAARAFAWVDLDGDGQLDLVTFGDSIEIAEGGTTLDEVGFGLDACSANPQPDTMCKYNGVAFAGTALPGFGGATGTIIASAISSSTDTPQRALYMISPNFGTPPKTGVVPFTANCPTCAPVIAVTAWDVNGDNFLDLVIIDTALEVSVAYSANAPITPATPFTKLPIPALDSSATATAVRMSIAGAQR